MAVPLLITKLYIPKVRPELILRPHLIEQLNAGLQRKLTLISAPAGFGKTSILAEWVSSFDLPSAWFSMDESDNDLARFFAYFVASLQTIKADIGEATLEAIQSLQPMQYKAVMTPLINEIHDMQEAFVLVLDDYHVINAEPVHRTLTFLLDHLPPKMHIVIASRADPPLPLARLRGQDQLIEIRTADLRFSYEEVSNFLNKVMGLNLSREDLSSLEERTEGWVTGLQMVALWLQGKPAERVPDFVKAFSGSHRYIIDYLADEVFNRQSPSIQSFLLKTAILNRLTGHLCDAVTGNNDGQEMLERLDDANLFLFSLDSERRWYRYHSLFADLLRNRLNLSLPEQIHELHRRACRWYTDNGQMDEAVNHALAADDTEWAADLIEQCGRSVVTRGEFNTLSVWLRTLPDQLVRSRPHLCIYDAWVLSVSGKFDDAESRLQDIDTWYESQVSRDDDSENQPLLGEVAAIRAIIAHLKDEVPSAIELSKKALDRLPADDLYLRGLLEMNLGSSYRDSGAIDAAQIAYTEAWRIGQKTGHAITATIALTGLASLQMMKGHLLHAAETYKQALQFGTERRAPVASVAYIGMGALMIEWNDLEAATSHLLRGLELAKQLGVSLLLTEGYVGLARVKMAQGNLHNAGNLLQQAEQFSQGDHTTRSFAQVTGCRVKLWLAQGSLTPAITWAQEYEQNKLDYPGNTINYTHQIEHLALSRVFVSMGQADKAIRLLEQLQAAAEAAGWVGSIIEILSLQALAFQAKSDSAQALNTFQKALTLAEPEGYIRTFVDEGEPMAQLLRSLITTRRLPIVSDYMKILLAAFPLGERELKISLQPSPSSAELHLLEPLTKREREVLRMLKTDLSGPEIAYKLYISLNTLHTHTKNIYSKLNVNNRLTAVRRAEELNLL